MSTGTRGELRNDLRWSAGHVFDNTAADRGEVDGVTAQDHYALIAVGPSVER